MKRIMKSSLTDVIWKNQRFRSLAKKFINNINRFTFYLSTFSIKDFYYLFFFGNSVGYKIEKSIELHPRIYRGRRITLRTNSIDLKILFKVIRSKYHLPHLPIHPSSWILDLGANIGCTTMDYAIKFPGNKILAVEMDEENYKVLSKNLLPFGKKIHLEPIRKV